MSGADFEPWPDYYPVNPPPVTSVPMREQTWADHDEPWQFQSYHLSEREKSALLRLLPRERLEEWRDGEAG